LSDLLFGTGEFDVASGVFYFFAYVLLICAVMVIAARNSVHSVFFLILAFFTAAGLFVLIGAEYLAMTLVIVYVGAVAVLFLFVVMMLNVNFASLRAGFLQYLPMGIVVALVLFVQMALLLYASLISPSQMVPAQEPLPDAAQISNAEAIGRVLYTDYIHLFQLAGVVLLVAMIGAIVLTLRQRPGVKKQKIAKQVMRKRSEGVSLANPKPGQGV
jgi:NADH-quinone oxidoreductase subunit J